MITDLGNNHHVALMAQSKLHKMRARYNNENFSPFFFRTFYSRILTELTDLNFVHYFIGERILSETVHMSDKHKDMTG
jgi:hypothetical protein